MIRSLEESQVTTIRMMRYSGLALRQIREFCTLNYRRTIPGPTISRICSGELYADCNGPRLTPKQAKRLADTRRRIASEARRKAVAA